MNTAQRFHWLAYQAIVWLLVLLPTIGCQRSSTDRGSQNRSVLRVSGWKNQPADLLVWMDDPGKTNYSAPQFTRLPYTDPYVVERGGGHGGIRLMSEGGRLVKEFVIPRQEIEAIIRMRFDMDVVDWTDVIIGRSKVTLIHTGYANAGVFFPSEVCVFPRLRNGFDYLNMMETGAWEFDNVKLLYPALLFYETKKRNNHAE